MPPRTGIMLSTSAQHIWGSHTIRRYPSIYPPLPPPDFETKGGINTTFLADRSIMQKITPKNFRLRRAEKYMILLILSKIYPKNFRLRRANLVYFPCIQTFKTPKKFAPAAGYKQSLLLSIQYTIARRRREIF